jgi:Co/Zn/Cd efflux system component
MLMGHDHDHAHDKQADHGRAFLIATTLNMSFVVLGTVYGILAHSVALLARTARPARSGHQLRLLVPHE